MNVCRSQLAIVITKSVRHAIIMSVMNERWPPTPPLHRLPALRSVFVAWNRRTGLCRFVRPVCRNPSLHHHLRPPQCNRPDISKGNLSTPRNGPGRFCCCQSATLACFIPHPTAHRPAHLSRRSALQLALSRAAFS